MNLKYKDGDFVVCEPVSEYRGDLRNGLDVVVQRRSRDSASAEVTLKEVVIRNGELWLVPRSDNPAHQPIMLRNNIDQHFDDGGDPPVSVTAVVTYSVQRRA